MFLVPEYQTVADGGAGFWVRVSLEPLGRMFTGRVLLSPILVVSGKKRLGGKAVAEEIVLLWEPWGNTQF